MLGDRCSELAGIWGCCPRGEASRWGTPRSWRSCVCSSAKWGFKTWFYSDMFSFLDQAPDYIEILPSWQASSLLELLYFRTRPSQIQSLVLEFWGEMFCWTPCFSSAKSDSIAMLGAGWSLLESSQPSRIPGVSDPGYPTIHILLGFWGERFCWNWSGNLPSKADSIAMLGDGCSELAGIWGCCPRGEASRWGTPRSWRSCVCSSAKWGFKTWFYSDMFSFLDQAPDYIEILPSWQASSLLELLYFRTRPSQIQSLVLEFWGEMFCWTPCFSSAKSDSIAMLGAGWSLLESSQPSRIPWFYSYVRG